MKEKKRNKIHVRLHEYILYGLVTTILLFLAIPIIVARFIGYLVRSTGAPLKSVKNLIGFLLVIIIIASGITAYEMFASYNIGDETRSVMVQENDGFAHVLAALKERQILRGQYLFKLFAVLGGVDKSLAPGRYDFTGRVSLYGILRKFKRHDIATVLITVPEGLTIDKTAGIFARHLGIDSSAFVARAFDTSFVRDKYGVEGLEGYLFPESYRFRYGIKIDEIINMMVSEFNRRSAGSFQSIPSNWYSQNEILILASIIEAEAQEGDEKKLISSVYHNRLERGMLLQADPTVIYALGGLDRPLYYHDLKHDSPYNTYKYKGLPPGPINSPGLEAIEAALSPAETNYLYFVADGTGRHVFSTTLTDHNRAKHGIKKAQKVKKGS